MPASLHPVPFRRIARLGGEVPQFHYSAPLLAPTYMYLALAHPRETVQALLFCFFFFFSGHRAAGHRSIPRVHMGSRRGVVQKGGMYLPA